MKAPPTFFQYKQSVILYHKDKHNFQIHGLHLNQHYDINNRILVQLKHVQQFWQKLRTENEENNFVII